MLIKKIFVFLLCTLPVWSIAQCDITLSGTVTDSGNGEYLEFVNIFLEGVDKGAVTDSVGYFKINGLCADHYHLVLSHIGCEAFKIHVDLEKDSILYLHMDHTAHILTDIHIVETQKPVATQAYQNINKLDINDNHGKGLAELISSIAGVSSLKSGNGVAKPIIQGNYGNRLAIINNGVLQSGQQWGNDHSPEIDPMMAQKISVVKGVSAVEYMNGNLGSLILIEPEKISKEPHIHGSLGYYFEQNGRGHGLHLQLGQHTNALAWKINGSLKNSGDRSTTTYFLNNTGIQEANLAIQLEKKLSDKFFVDAYLSTFNTQIGILRGAHIGNLTDLEKALTEPVPFFTEEDFSYAIESPRQQVSHHLLKIHSNYYLDDHQWLDFTLATQINSRKEFDVRRSGRSEIPALSLAQNSLFAEGKYNNEFTKDLSIKSGIQLHIKDNTNNPETGILPLIPDFLSYKIGGFFLANKKVSNHSLEAGVRYDFKNQSVVTIDGNSSPATIIRHNNQFHNMSGSIGWSYSTKNNLGLSLNTGFATRNPEINELYSFGLHQGVSGIEEGNTALRSEQSFKTSAGIQRKGDKIYISSLFYVQKYNDYIYLNPQDEIRLTIRGAFPVFKYEQIKADLYGMDILAQWDITASLQLDASYSHIKARDLTNNLALINIPTNNLSQTISYGTIHPIKIGSYSLHNLELALRNEFSFRKNDIIAGQDFILPPDGYHLMGLKLSGALQLNKLRLRIIITADNLTNKRYRDYLNRQRYFADELGRNIKLTFNLKF